LDENQLEHVKFILIEIVLNGVANVFVSPITWSVLRGTGIRFIDMNAFHLNYAAIFESDINILTLFHLVDLTFED